MSSIQNPQFVWYDAHGAGRNRFAYFRRSFSLSAICEPALLNLFADNAYQLFVNGSFVQFGPARFDVRYPLFDAVDISSYLQVGHNVIAVLVKSFGCKTFKDNSERGGFVAWGSWADGAGGEVDLATSADSSWKVKRCDAFDPDALKLSFALDAIDIYEQAKAEEGWVDVDFDDSSWSYPAEIEKQESWGELRARTIPFMELTEVPFRIDRPVDSLERIETIHGFSVPGSRFHGKKDIFEGSGEMSIGLATWIYSPRAQEIVAGLFWGKYFLNGEMCEEGIEVSGLRRNIPLSLKQGWNCFFATERFIDDCLSFMFGVPTEAALQFSPRQRLGDSVQFVRTDVVPPARLQQELDKAVPLPFAPCFDDVGGWQEVASSETENNPARRSMWDRYGEHVETVSAEALPERTFSLSRFPNGFSFMLDFGEMRLVLPCLKLSGAAGATVDICYSEHLGRDGAHLEHSLVYPAGDRIRVSNNWITFMSSQPRGSRYCRVTVRGASGDVRFESVRFLSCRYPVRKLGKFRCSDPLLNEIWEMCERTQHANMEDAFVDCAGRERGMYLRDTIIQFHNALAAYGDTRLMSRCMQLFGQSPDETGKFRAVYPNSGDYTISDFAIEAIDGYWQYYLNTGDVDRLREDWPAMLESMAWFNELSDEREDGLLDADWPENRGVEAAYGGLHGDNKVPESLLDKTGPNACLTFPYLSMLASATRIARLLGHDEQALAFESRRLRISASSRDLLWNHEKGCFNDNLAGKTQSYQASILAVLSDTASPAQVSSIRAHFLRRFKNVFINGYSANDGAYFSPAYSFVVFQGLYELGLAGLAETLIKQGWGWMLAQGSRTTPEFFDFETSHCHAWSACPMYYLSKHGLGVRFPEAPDFSVVEIEIRSDLEWAEGSFPIPGTDSVVEVAWRRRIDGDFDLKVSAPEGVTVLRKSELGRIGNPIIS